MQSCFCCCLKPRAKFTTLYRYPCDPQSSTCGPTCGAGCWRSNRCLCSRCVSGHCKRKTTSWSPTLEEPKLPAAITRHIVAEGGKQGVEKKENQGLERQGPFHSVPNEQKDKLTHLVLVHGSELWSWHPRVGRASVCSCHGPTLRVSGFFLLPPKMHKHTPAFLMPQNDSPVY